MFKILVPPFHFLYPQLSYQAVQKPPVRNFSGCTGSDVDSIEGWEKPWVPVAMTTCHQAHCHIKCHISCLLTLSLTTNFRLFQCLSEQANEHYYATKLLIGIF